MPMISKMDVAVYRIPTNEPESDGTLSWDHTDVMVTEVHAADLIGLGWSYASTASAAMAADLLKPAMLGRSALSIEQIWQEMNHRLRNAGRPGTGMMAVAAIDVALWDLKAKLLGVSLVDLFGAVRESIPVYGSGGFTSYTPQKLRKQLSKWVKEGIPRVKMKVGRDAQADGDRVRMVRESNRRRC